ncbi:MAG: ABC transporter permease [Chloroflexota bacterium]|nr:ABC transporter permease [Chloroflexota bacterium]
MGLYLLKRLLLAVPVLFGITLLVFIALRLAPGDPALYLAGFDADGATVQAIRVENGLDKPLPEQYVVWLGNLAHLDLGRSVTTREPVARELEMRYPITFNLAVAATLLATVVGVAVGVVAARFQRTWIDYGLMGLAMAWLSVPNYVLGLLLILLFAVTLGLLPAVGASKPVDYILPVVTVAAVGAGMLARQTRAAMLEVLSQDFIRTARAKGLAERHVLARHALRNALIPVLTTIGVVFGNLMAGTVIVESVFGVPGIGKLMVDRILARDYPTVQGAVLFIACSYVFVNILVDLAYVAADRRVRLS